MTSVGERSYMSTLSGKPIDQTSPSSFPSPRLNEEPLVENGDVSEPGAAASASAYAPKRLRVVSSAAPATPEPDTDDFAAAPSFLTRDKKPRGEQRGEPRLVVDPVVGPMRM